jgi:hypothetical protein
MSATATAEPRWATAAPLWDGVAAGAEQTRPAILRFVSDSFMDELAALLADDPGRLASLIDGRDEPTLYLPAHGHFYLVVASLVCAGLGLPDRVVDEPAGEQVGFLLRRLDGADDELAWAADPAAPGRRAWSAPAGGEASLAVGEEVLPLVPIRFELDGPRRLLAGLVPTFSGEFAADGTPKIEGEELYRLRCVYRRPQCGALRPDLLSDPSLCFRVSPFNEEELPFRPGTERES